MMYLNRFDVEEAAARFENDSVLGPATLTLQNLVDWTDDNSDGWPYWRKPSNASARLQKLVGYALDEMRRNGRHDVTAADVRKAYGPVKAFRTRQVAAGKPSFDIVAVTS